MIKHVKQDGILTKNEIKIYRTGKVESYWFSIIGTLLRSGLHLIVRFVSTKPAKILAYVVSNL